MKSCPTCREQFDDEMMFCTFDGTPLQSPGGRTGSRGRTKLHPGDQESSARIGNGWKVAFFLLLFVTVAAGGVFAYLAKRGGKVTPQQTIEQKLPDEKQSFGGERPPEVPLKKASLLEMSQQELMENLPKNLLRRFHLGEPGQGTPDDLRIISADKEELVVLVGSGRLEGSSRTSAERLLILKYDGTQFTDVTKQSVAGSYGSGIVKGRGAQIKFEDGTNTIFVREPASSSSVVQECASCDHAYQIVTLEWKNGRYVETARTWDSDRYTVFYLVAEALEKKKIDARARPFIDPALEPVIAQGFPRTAKEGWLAEWRDDDDSETASYELTNTADRLVITLSRAKGDWRAVQIR
jgi:hypothetical protein